MFLLSRYREELLDAKSANPHRAVLAAMHTGGHTVLVSGVTLAVCFAGLILLPLDSMRSLGIGTAVAVVVSIAVNLTLTPVLLLLFPRFFARCVSANQCGCFSLTWGARAQSAFDAEDSQRGALLGSDSGNFSNILLFLTFKFNFVFLFFSFLSCVVLSR